MATFFHKATLAAALAATVGLTAAPAEARDRYYRHRGGGDDAALAIGAGLVGLAIGAAIASNNRDRYDDGYYNYDRRYNYPRNRYNGYPAYRANPRYNYRYRDDYYRQREHDRRYGNGYGYGYRR